jgi:hypothetical protein
MSELIPQRIVQTGKSRDLPLLQRAAAMNVRLLHPEFEYHFYDDQQVAEFLAAEPTEHAETFATLPCPIQKIDFFRYLVIYRHGGFYLDLDVLLATKLDPLLATGCVFSFEDLNICRYLRDELGFDWALGNYAFGAAPGHPFLKAIIANCVRAQRDPAWVKPMLRGIPRWFQPEFRILSTTGPLLVSRTLAENPALAETLTILFPDDVCAPRNRHRFGDYGVHLMQASWRTRYGRLRRILAGLWEARAHQQCERQNRQPDRRRPQFASRLKPAIHPSPLYAPGQCHYSDLQP